MNSVPTSSELLLHTTQTLLVDAVEELQYLLYSYPDILLSNPKGVYQVGHLFPVLRDGEYYYTRKGLREGKPIKDLDSINEAVFDGQGRMLINDFAMKHKRQFLSNESSLSKAGLHAIYCFTNKKIEDNCAYSRFHRYEEPFLSCFKPEYREAVRHGEIDVDLMLGRLGERINDFIQSEPWTIYFVKKISTLLLIEKTVDFRIYDWTLQKEAERNKNFE